MVNDRSRPTSEQLRRLAFVYIRQSSPGQVVNNVESRELQYEFVERAVSLGWDRERVVVIDQDQGRRGSQSDNRDGFQRLVAEVGLGHVGLVLGIEVSRLARRNADWYNLMDLCAPDSILTKGVDGAIEDGAIELSYRHSTAFSIYGGSSEIMRSIIAQVVLGMPRSRS